MLGSSRGFLILLVAIFSAMTISVSAASQPYSCLPTGVKTGDIVRVVELSSRSGDVRMKTVSVAESLKSIKAKCSKGKLVDSKKKEIKFYRIEGCWGNPPEDYLEIQARQRRELAELKRKNNVIEISCNTEVMRLIQ